MSRIFSIFLLAVFTTAFALAQTPVTTTQAITPIGGGAPVKHALRPAQDEIKTVLTQFGIAAIDSDAQARRYVGRDQIMIKNVVDDLHISPFSLQLYNEQYRLHGFGERLREEFDFPMTGYVFNAPKGKHGYGELELKCDTYEQHVVWDTALGFQGDAAMNMYKYQLVYSNGGATTLATFMVSGEDPVAKQGTLVLTYLEPGVKVSVQSQDKPSGRTYLTQNGMLRLDNPFWTNQEGGYMYVSPKIRIELEGTPFAGYCAKPRIIVTTGGWEGLSVLVPGVVDLNRYFYPGEGAADSPTPPSGSKCMMPDAMRPLQ